MPHISDLLANYRHLIPNPTGVAPELSRHDGPVPKVLLFDIYGTLLLSASGDIDKVKLDPAALAEAVAPFGLPFPPDEDFFLRLIKQYQSVVSETWYAQRTEDRPFPEIDILSVWERLLAEFAGELSPAQLPPPEQLRHVAMVFELCTNPVTPMPGMKALLDQLREEGLRLGIVSNAQFYTPVILNYFLTGKWEQTPDLSRWFDHDLCVYSYRECRAKPDARLFDKIKEILTAEDVPGEEVMFIGNDVKKDLMPAAAVGFRTILFAGDARSLRLYRHEPAAAIFRPDYTITELQQIPEICLS